MRATSMNSVRYVIAALLCLTFLAAAPLHAAVIYNNGGPLLTPTPAQGALFADPGNGSFVEAADDFVLPEGQNVIRDIHWWGIAAVAPVDNFVINIYNDNGGTVGTLNTAVSISSVQHTDTGSTITGREMYLYDAVVSDITLTAGTTYWLGISNTSGGEGSSAWAWVIAANSGNAHQYSVPNNNWGNSTNKTLAFNLTNTVVPEPSTLALAIVGGLIVLGVRRRRAEAN